MPILSTVTTIGEDSTDLQTQFITKHRSIIATAEVDEITPVSTGVPMESHSRPICLGTCNVLSFRRSSAVSSMVPVQVESERQTVATADTQLTPPMIGLRISRSLPEIQNMTRDQRRTIQENEANELFEHRRRDQASALTPRTRRRNLIAVLFSPRSNRRQTEDNMNTTNNPIRAEIARTSITAVVDEHLTPPVQQQGVFRRIRRFFRSWSTNTSSHRKRK